MPRQQFRSQGAYKPSPLAHIQSSAGEEDNDPDAESLPSASPAPAATSAALINFAGATSAAEGLGAQASANLPATAVGANDNGEKHSYFTSFSKSGDKAELPDADEQIIRSTMTTSVASEYCAEATANEAAAATADADADASSDSSSEYGDEVPTDHMPVTTPANLVTLPSWATFSTKQLRLKDPRFRAIANEGVTLDEGKSIQMAVFPCGHWSSWKNILEYWRGGGPWGRESNNCPFCRRELFRFQKEDLIDPLTGKPEPETAVVPEIPIFVDAENHRNNNDAAV